MATHIDRTRPVSREVTPARRVDAPLIVTMKPEGIYFREKGRRRAFLLPYSTGYLVSVRLHVEHEKREKAARRKARRSA